MGQKLFIHLFETFIIINVLLFIVSTFILGDRGLMALNVLSALSCYIAIVLKKKLQ